MDNVEILGIEGSISAKLKTLQPTLIAKWTAGGTESLNGFKVFNHGNFWTKNILFKYVKDEYVDAVFVSKTKKTLNLTLHYGSISIR